MPSAEQLDTSGTEGGVVVPSPPTVIGVEVDSTSISSVLVDEVEEPGDEVAETAGVETPVVVAKAVSTSCESRNCPAFLNPCSASGRAFPSMLVVVVLSGVLVAVEVAIVVEGIAASSISTIFGGGKFSIVLDASGDVVA